MRKEVVAGVAGAGVFGGYHAGKYAALDGVRLAGVFDLDAARAETLAGKHSAEAFSDYDAFLNSVDVVTVAAPAAAHFELASLALAAGKHVLVEKPIAIDLTHADLMIAQAESSGLVLQVGHQERFVFEAFGILSRRRKPRLIECVRRNPATGRGEDVSATLDLMIHDLDLLRRFNFGDLVEIEAEGGADDLTARFQFKDDCVAQLTASRCAEACERHMRLGYDDGVIEIDFVNRTVRNTTPAPLNASFESGSLDSALTDPLGFGVARFVDAVRGETPTPIRGEDGRAALEWALMADEALKNVQNVKTQKQRAIA